MKYFLTIRSKWNWQKLYKYDNLHLSVHVMGHDMPFCNVYKKYAKYNSGWLYITKNELSILQMIWVHFYYILE